MKASELYGKVIYWDNPPTKEWRYNWLFVGSILYAYVYAYVQVYMCTAMSTIISILAFESYECF